VVLVSSTQFRYARSPNFSQVTLSTATPTATTYKLGEEAQRAKGVSSIKEPWHMLHSDYSPIMMLGILALGWPCYESAGIQIICKSRKKASTVSVN
jgi:hypothetical protein